MRRHSRRNRLGKNHTPEPNPPILRSDRNHGETSRPFLEGVLPDPKARLRSPAPQSQLTLARLYGATSTARPVRALSRMATSVLYWSRTLRKEIKSFLPPRTA